MLIPPLFDSWLSIVLYLLLVFITVKGIWQYAEQHRQADVKIKSLVPIGAIATILGIIGNIRGYMMTFDAIEAAGDISPQIVAHSFGQSGSYPILGLLGLATSYLFKYLNQ